MAKGMILAAGQGTRVRPLTKDLPKPMVPILGKPVMEYLIEHLARHGITEIMVNVAYHHHKIEQYFGDGHRWGVQIGYAFEGVRDHGDVIPKPFGSAGGMLFSEVKLGDRVRAGQRLGKVIDPIQNLESAIVSPVRGKVLGMALNQIVLPGFAAYHVGIETSEQRVAEEAARAAAASLDAGATDIDDPEEDDGAGTPIERAPEDEDGER